MEANETHVRSEEVHCNKILVRLLYNLSFNEISKSKDSGFQVEEVLALIQSRCLYRGRKSIKLEVAEIQTHRVAGKQTTKARYQHKNVIQLTTVGWKEATHPSHYLISSHL
ncbi:hypothetical protein ACH5RR_011401 [Cinchona calisaya]|uniref:Uncharacterized protein n=1 Tax=Cinchona calisaya TaxID=153742 RepID=A0ABD3A4R8_9GENT